MGIEDVLYDMFEILHFSEEPYEELKRRSNEFMVKITKIKNRKETQNG